MNNFNTKHPARIVRRLRVLLRPLRVVLFRGGSRADEDQGIEEEGRSTII